MRLRIPFALTLAILSSFACAASPPNRMTQEEVTEGWLILFDGETMVGWRATSDANWKVQDGALTASAGRPGLLLSVAVYTDYILKADFRSTPQTNSGIFLRTPAKPTDPAADCYELNIADESVSPFPTGSLVDRAKATGNVESGAWHTFTVHAKGERLRISVDDQEVVDYTDPKPIRMGHIGLQFNAGPIEFRNLKIKPGGSRGD